jgi:hypothetical protein
VETERGRSWGKLILFGCLGVFGTACAAIAVVVALNWSAISGFVREATSRLKEISAVQKVLQEKYRTSQVKLHVEHSTSFSDETLIIEFEDAPFLRGLESAGPEEKQKALEIAATARDALPADRGFERYRVVFSARLSLGLVLTTTRSYVFLEGDLPPPGSH